MDANDPVDPPFARPVSQLAYADLPARHGIIFERSGAGHCMISVPVSVWRQLIQWGLMPAIVGGLIHPLLGIGIMLIGIAVAAFQLLTRRPMVFTVTPDELVIENVVAESAIGTVRYDRADVHDLKYVNHSNRIVVHARGHQMLELSPSGDRKVLEWIADTLQQELWPDRGEATSPQS